MTCGLLYLRGKSLLIPPKCFFFFIQMKYNIIWYKTQCHKNNNNFYCHYFTNCLQRTRENRRHNTRYKYSMDYCHVSICYINYQCFQRNFNENKYAYHIVSSFYETNLFFCFQNIKTRISHRFCFANGVKYTFVIF